MPIITLHNGAWQAGVTVEARKGMSFDFDQNESLGTQTIAYQDDWKIHSWLLRGQNQE